MSEAQKYAKDRKTGIVVMVERGGHVRANVPAVVYTDEWAGYRNVHTTQPTHFTIRRTPSEHFTRGRSKIFWQRRERYRRQLHGVFVKWPAGTIGLPSSPRSSPPQQVRMAHNHRADDRAMFVELLRRAATSTSR